VILYIDTTGLDGALQHDRRMDEPTSRVGHHRRVRDVFAVRRECQGQHGSVCAGLQVDETLRIGGIVPDEDVDRTVMEDVSEKFDIVDFLELGLDGIDFHEDRGVGSIHAFESEVVVSSMTIKRVEPHCFRDHFVSS
jgi:hypothetical protein